ncbi:hypothetical protein BDZ85DRAFT_29908 [Elsinoe ampelina]|uniref:Uncharacterized protein n=1 Tax=Elsinoe ampelina TaxID=302913 RepID=A0A6A6G4N5_9PEZI|nr:hypothetical protein BDZ85DRAFT_29908 [Elsinoe ampelina]
MVTARDKISLKGCRSGTDDAIHATSPALVSCSDWTQPDQAASDGNGLGFFSLPIEIRHMIYRYHCLAITDEIFEYNSGDHVFDQLVHSVTMVTCWENEWEVVTSDAVLSKASRQLRAELNAMYSPMLYLRISDDRPTIRHLDRWLLRHEAKIA